MANKSRIKFLTYILLVVIMNIVTIVISISCYKNYSSQNEAKRLNDKIASKEIENVEDICGMVFNYEFQLGLKDGKTKEYSGSENYYWDGKKFFSASEFMKGYE